MPVLVSDAWFVDVPAISQATLSPSSADSAVLPTGGGSSKWVIDSKELLTSTNEQRFWTFGPMGLMAATFVHATSQVTDVKDAAILASVMLVAYVLSDLGTGGQRTCDIFVERIMLSLCCC